MQSRMPQYLHLPQQILWVDSHELLVLLGAYVGSVVLKGWSWVFLFALAVFFIRFKRRKPRGYIAHLFYRAGFFPLKRYPLPAARLFHE